MFDYLVVGAGLAGCTIAERLASQLSQRVLIVERRSHIGGNTYDYYNDDGVLVHRYGPHIFHTNSKQVVDYLSQFTTWRPYEHRVLASVDGQLLPIPVNLDTINRFYGLNLSSAEVEGFLAQVKQPRESVITSEDVVVSQVGWEIYEKFFRNYTRKQWGLDPSQLDASVIARVPLRKNRDGRYFTDTYQLMPRNGYTRMLECMVNHPNIKILLNTDYREVIDYIHFNQMVYTGPIDMFFDRQFGRLPYRSIDFVFDTIDTEYFLPTGTINYPNEYAFTRITEFKHLTAQKHTRTTVVYEYPTDEGDPYYPIPCAKNHDLYRRYKQAAAKLQSVHFVGRLATYKYYNMDQVVAAALSTYENLAKAE